MRTLALGLAILWTCALAHPAWCSSTTVQFGQNLANFSVLRSGTVSRISRPGIQLIPSEAAFQRYWMQLTGQDPRTTPRQNWVINQLIAVNLGNRPSGGYSVYVTGVEQSGLVHAVEVQPQPGQWVAKQVTSPYVILSVSKGVFNATLDLTQSQPSNLHGVTVYGNDYAQVNPDSYIGQNVGPTVNPENLMSFDVIGNFSDAACDASGVFVLSTYGDWDKYAASVFKSGTHPYPVNWAQYSVIAVHLGRRPCSGYRVRVLSLERNGSTGIVHALEEAPVPGSYVSKVETRPYLLLRVPRNILNFTLDLSHREGDGAVHFVGGGGR